MHAGLGRVIVYTKRIPEMVAFYSTVFGYDAIERPGNRIIELRPNGPGMNILLHPAANGQAEGQVLVKLVFDIEDVAGFCRLAKEAGVEFGPIHCANGYIFANAKDPAGNPVSVSVSGRAFADSDQRKASA